MQRPKEPRSKKGKFHHLVCNLCLFIFWESINISTSNICSHALGRPLDTNRWPLLTTCVFTKLAFTADGCCNNVLPYARNTRRCAHETMPPYYSIASVWRAVVDELSIDITLEALLNRRAASEKYQQKACSEEYIMICSARATPLGVFKFRLF